MKNRFNIFGSFRFQVAVAMVLMTAFVLGVSSFLISEYSLKNQFEQLRGRLATMAQLVALTVDAGTIAQIPLNKGGIDTAPYKATETALLKIRKVVPSISYIYILKKTDKKEILQFIIDLPFAAAGQNGPPPAYPGKAYDASRFSEMIEGFSRPMSDDELMKDEWGVFLSGYAPIRDQHGNTVAVLGLDMAARDIYVLQGEVRKRAGLLLVFGIVVSLILGTIISGRVAKPLGELVKGIRHIASGDMEYKVRVRGAAEIAELGWSFNQMAKRLAAAKRTLLGYFYRVVQALIRALEAKDAYTKGHSDRVAEYSEKIGAAMGLASEKLEILKEAALLHDIGKLGVQEIILNKKAMLTPEERKDIEKHPVIGAQILESVSPDKEILAVVRGHHEHYDGSGYPDGLKGENIGILASIVSVADSYDAMTSHRAYRTNLSEEEALDQLRKNSGTQFSPDIVAAFIKALKSK